MGLIALWPKTTSTKSSSNPIIVKAGETYDAYAINGPSGQENKINY